MMTRRLTKALSILGATSLLVFSACSEGSDDGGDGDGDGDMGGDGDGDATGDGDGDTTGDGDTGDGDGDTTGDGDGDGGVTEGTIQHAFDADVDPLYVGWEEPDTWSANNGMGGAGNVSTLSWVDDDGDPDDGAVQVDIPFDFPPEDAEPGTSLQSLLQKVHLQVDLDGETDLSDTIIRANIKLVSGGSEECPINAKIFSKSGGSYVWGDGGAINLIEGMWLDDATMIPSSPSFTCSPDTCDGTTEDYDASAVTQIGIEVSPSTGEGCVTGDVTILVDSFAY